MSEPTVSVIIPTRDRLPYLREALDSVLAQTFRDYEVIVIDDGSEADVAAAVANHPTKPRVLQQEHQGPAAARNLGIREARGRLIAFLDSDDLWLPQKLEVYLETMARESENSIFYGPMQPIDAYGHPMPGRTKRCYPGQITEKLFCSSFVHVPTVVCRKDVLVDLGGFDPALPVCEDYDLWLRASLNHSFGLIEEPLAKRRLHENRLSKQSMSRNLAVKARVLHAFYTCDALNGHLNREVGAARIARVFFAAGRAALHNGEYERALEFTRASKEYGYSSLRTVPIAAAANALGFFSRSG